MGTTPNWDIYRVETGDSGDPVAESTIQAESIETALDTLSDMVGDVNYFGIATYADASARDLDITSPQTGYLTKLQTEFFPRLWNGSAWVPWGSGKVPIVPSGATAASGSVSVSTPDGLITCSAASGVSVNGSFAAGYKHVIDLSGGVELTGAGSLRLRLRASGTDNSTASSYLGGMSRATSASPADVALVAKSLDFSPVSDNDVGAAGDVYGQITLTNVADANQTMLQIETDLRYSTSSVYQFRGSIWHNQSVAYDGFTLYTDTGGITGSFKVYRML